MGGPEPGFEDFLEEKKRVRNPFVPIGNFTLSTSIVHILSLSCSVNFDFAIRFIVFFLLRERKEDGGFKKSLE